MIRVRFILLLLFFSVSAFAGTKINYQPSGGTFANPERGFFSSFPGPTYTGFALHQTWRDRDIRTLAGLEEIRAKGQSTVSLDYNLKEFRNQKLSKAELDLIENNFQLIRKAGLKCIIRFAYSESIGEPDAPLNIVLMHIGQLKPILQANYDIIAVMQAGFIGAWGEWHSSTNGLDNVSDRRKILFAELDALPKVRMVQLRTPHFKEEIFGRTTPISRSEAFNESKFSRVGEHNDCFLANWNDYGTYADTAAQKEFISQDCKYVPMGGETCHLSEYCECGNAIGQMEKLHWSLLNSGWNPAVYKQWEAEGCLDQVRKRLGYRLELISGTFDDSLSQGDSFGYSIRLTNVGFAALYNPRDVEIILQSESNNDRYVAALPTDPRFWQPGDTIDVSGQIGIPSSVPAGKYSVYLNLPDPTTLLHFRPDYSVRLANQGVWEASTGYNNLGFKLNVYSGQASQVSKSKLVFRKLIVPTMNTQKKNDQ